MANPNKRAEDRLIAGLLALFLALQFSLPSPAGASPEPSRRTLRTEGVDASTEEAPQGVRAGLEAALRENAAQDLSRRDVLKTAALTLGAAVLPDLFRPAPAQTVQVSLEAQIDQTLASLPLDKKVALFQSMGWVGTTPLEDERARHLLVTEQVGAMTLYDYNLGTAAESARMIGGIFQATVEQGKRISVFNIDAEGGRLYTNVRGATMVPGNMALGAIYTANPELGRELAREQGRMIAHELRTWGVTWTLSPVIDVNSNPNNPVIANRSIGEDPNTVGPVAVAQIEGLQSEGVAATVKHVPDHGDTAFDTHYGMAVDLRPRDQIGGITALKQAIAAGVAAIMPSHVAYPNAF